MSVLGVLPRACYIDNIPLSQMKRRKFLEQCGLTGTAILSAPFLHATQSTFANRQYGSELKADIIIIGGGMGGCAAALAACGQGRSVILTEPTDWIGGQVTQQGVPPDEHQWIETIPGLSLIHI